jgi:hypothetical protein
MLVSDNPTCRLHDSKEFTSSLHVFHLIETLWSQAQILTLHHLFFEDTIAKTIIQSIKHTLLYVYSSN